MHIPEEMPDLVDDKQFLIFTEIRAVRIMIFITTGYCIYESIQPVLPKGTFDIKDIIATLIGGCCAYMLFLAIHKTNDILKTEL